jgi:hypothetical protein
MRPVPDASGAGRLAVDVACFIQDDEAIAATQVVIEIDVATEHVGERERDGVRQPGLVGGREERRLDLPGAHRDACVIGRCFPLRREARRGAADRQDLPVAGKEPQARQAAVVIGRDLERTARTQLIERACRRIRAQEFHCVRILDRCAGQQAADRVAPLHTLLAPIAIGWLGIQRISRDRQCAVHVVHRNGVQYGVRRDAECGHSGESEDGDREALPRRERVRECAQCGTKRVR